ncbi:MAG: PorT family protein [Bacteroidia bacterium]|jgi:hypothetical protein|nr:PorT family protein [Bacteroidia bacterium]MBP9724998.1 PorT family protein [Bacteroidia bacterium]
MKKVILFTAIVSLFAINNVQAQAGAAFGLKGGLNLNKLDPKTTGITSDMRVGPVGGLWVRAKVLGFFVQAEALYSTKGGKTTVPATPFTPAIESKLNNAYLDVPVLLGKSFFSVVRINAGPSFQYLLSAKNGSVDVKNGYNSFVVGYQAGVGVDIKKIGVDLRYDGNISNVTKSVSGVKNSTRSSVFQLTVAYKLFGVLND